MPQSLRNHCQRYSLSPSWAQAATPRIFPADDQFAAHRAAAWDAYLMFCRPYDGLLPLLEPRYLRSIQRLASADPKNKRGVRLHEHLAEHLMAYYGRDKLPLASDVLVAFFQFAPDELRARAVDFLGRSLAHQPDTPLDPSLLARLRTLWESRVETARRATEIANFREELSHFGWWFSSRRFAPGWSFEQLFAVLNLVKRITPEFKVAEALEDLAAEYPLECVRAVRLMAIADRRGWEIFANEKHFQAILATAIASGNTAAKAAADDLIQYFMIRGQFSFGALLG